MSDILNSVHDTVKRLHSNGSVGKLTMRHFDQLCLTEIRPFNPEDVRALRTKYQLSQPVFAEYFNVSSKLVKKWEQGESEPRGPALKLLILAEKKGLEAIT